MLIINLSSSPEKQAHENTQFFFFLAEITTAKKSVWPQTAFFFPIPGTKPFSLATRCLELEFVLQEIVEINPKAHSCPSSHRVQAFVVRLWALVAEDGLGFSTLSAYGRGFMCGYLSQD